MPVTNDPNNVGGAGAVGGTSGIVGPMPTFAAFKENLANAFSADLKAMRGVLADPKDDPDIAPGGKIDKGRLNSATRLVNEFEKLLCGIVGAADASIAPSMDFPRPDGSVGGAIAMYGITFTTAIQRLITMCNQQLEQMKFWLANAPGVTDAQRQQLGKEEAMVSDIIKKLTKLHNHNAVNHTKSFKNDPAQPLPA